MARKIVQPDAEAVQTRSFSKTERNPVRELADLRMRSKFENSSQENVEIHVDLWLGELNLLIGRNAAVIKIRKAVLQLVLDGFDIIPGSRFGAATNANETSIKEVHKVVNKSGINSDTSISASVKPSNISGSISGKIDAAFGRSSLNTSDFTTNRTLLRVRSAGNDSWIISEVDGRPMDEQILDDKLLCRLQMVSKANRYRIQSAVRVNKDDFSIKYNKRLSSLSINKKQVLGALLLKSLDNGESHDHGCLILSHLESNYE